MVCVRPSVRPSVRASRFCGRNSSETTERILLKFCMIVCQHMQLIILCRHFGSTDFTGVMGLYRLNAYYNIGTLCGRNSSETTERILLKFCMIVCQHMQLIILCRHFGSTDFTGVMGLYRLNAYYNIGTLCGRNSSETTERILLKFCMIVCQHMQLIILCRHFGSTDFT